MGYTKAALGTTPAIRNDLAGWKAHLLELHSELVAAGFVQTGDTGQLDISGVATLPANTTYAGYRIYEVDDDLAAAGYRIVFRLDFGVNFESLYGGNQNPNCIRVRTTVGTKTDGVGTILSQNGSTAITPAITWGNPQSYIDGGSQTTIVNVVANNYICVNPDKGFFGIVFSCNGRGSSGSGTQYGSFNGSTFTMMIQRSLDADGEPSNEGFTVYAPSLDKYAEWPPVVRFPFETTRYDPNLNRTYGYNYSDTTSISTQYAQVRAGGQDAPPISGDIQTSPCYQYVDGRLKFNPNMVTYRTQDLTEGTRFQIETSPGVVSTFIALGPGSGMRPDSFGQMNSFAMLFE